MDTLTAVRMRIIEDLCVEMSAHHQIEGTLTACAVVGYSIITAVSIAVHHLKTTADMEKTVMELLLTLIALLEKS